MKAKCLLGVMGLSVAFLSYAHQPENLTFFKQKLRQYHSTGEYAYDVSKVESQAKAYLNQRVKENQQATTKRKLAIVVDIDETALSNYHFDATHHFAPTGKQLTQHLAAGNDPAIPQTLSLYRDAVAHHVAVFFITGRFKSLTQATTKNLKAVGYKTWTALFLKPNNYSLHSAEPYKSSLRKKIASQGYDIILSIGDQYSDLNGGHADRVFKLPNAFYFVP